MTREQQRATDDELSRSAYDSAMAGVEDAKRVVVLCNNGVAAACRAITNDRCDTVPEAGVAGSTGEDEVLIESTTGVDGGLNQAYTCVKIATESTDYVSILAQQRSEMIPLKTTGAVESVRIEWQLPDDANSVEIWPTGTCRGSDFTSTNRLCTSATWGNNPAIIRVQAITPGSSINLDQLTQSDVSGTAFLYPTSLGSAVSNVTFNPRYAGDDESPPWLGANSPVIASCSASLVDYQCRATVQLPQTVPARNNLSLLRLTALYKGDTTIRVTPLDSSGQPVEFDGVQPNVDSTGRANDVFRRVLARLSLTSDFPYPENAVELEGSLCKNFYISDTGSGPASVSGAPVCSP
jgi:hypothetical protein